MDGACKGFWQFNPLSPKLSECYNKYFKLQINRRSSQFRNEWAKVNVVVYRIQNTWCSTKGVEA